MIAVLKADARKIPLADESVQCVVTSPPYWGLRKYAGEQELVWGGRGGCEHEWSSNGRRPPHPDRSTGDHDGNGSGIFVDRIERGSQAAKQSRGEAVEFGNTCFQCGAWRGAYGLEPTVEMYVQHTIEILREIRRVLRDDGVVFWNIGDSYAGSGKGQMGDGSHAAKHGEKQHTSKGTLVGGLPKAGGLKPKDLCLIPFRVALAAQADGWWVRSDIIWSKPNPMPESVTDRPTRAHEYIFLLTKNAKYYWDAEAVKEPARFGYSKWPEGALEHYKRSVGNPERQPARSASTPEKGDGSGGRNLRSVWTFATEPYPEAHFATFPEELPKRCILAATSSKGACAKCGTPWERVLSERKAPSKVYTGSRKPEEINPVGNHTQGIGQKYQDWLSKNPLHTIGWWPSCSCGGYRVRSVHSRRLSRHSWYRQHWQGRIEFKWPKTIPCLTLDPFAGSGTVGKVAIELGRRAILCDLAYQDLALKRTSAVQRPLPEILGA